MLDQLELFNKKSLSKANTTVKQGVSVLDQVELFNKKVLKQQSTNQFDQLSQLKRLEMELQALDYKLLGQTLLGKSSLSHDLNTLEQTPVNVAQWKKLTWVKFGRRHEITKAIDNGIGKYYQFFRQRKQALIRPRNCKQIPACLAIIAHRIEILQRDVLYPAQKWLSQLDSTHRTSPRRPAMTRLNAACQSERNALQALAMSLEKLHRRYALLSD